MLTRPRGLLHLEGATLFVLSVYAYQVNAFRWWLFAALFLVPDLFMLGYLINTKWGAAAYNLVHTVAGPAFLMLVALIRTDSRPFPYALIWLAHIGLDRMLGFGAEISHAIQRHSFATCLA